jgi:lambda repressor-like predicted transcriptional regulator
MAELIAAVAEVTAEEAGPGRYHRASERRSRL